LNDPDVEMSFSRLTNAAQNGTGTDMKAALIKSISIDGFSAEGTAEYIRAVEGMRDTNGIIITGLVDASKTSGSSANMSRVASGSVAEAFEPISIRRMIDSGEMSLGQVQEFGRKIPTADLTILRPDGTVVDRATIEADCFLKDKTFIDSKHSING